jgi:hypothetical protein
MKSIIIKIPNPCHEDWNRMTEREKGRFCSSCSKTVIDMSILTDNEIISNVKSDKDICGRFKSNQLNRDIKPQIPYAFNKTGWTIAASLFIGLSLLGSCENITEPYHEVGKMERIEVVDTIQDYDSDIMETGEVVVHDTTPEPKKEMEVGKVSVLNIDTLNIPKPPVIDDSRYYLGEPIMMDSTIEESNPEKTNK